MNARRRWRSLKTPVQSPLHRLWDLQASIDAQAEAPPTTPYAIRFTRQLEPYEGYWAKSERRAMNHASQLLMSSLKGRNHISALDVGCGEGRLLPWISSFATRITAIDPDKKRLALAEASNSQLNGRSDITYSGSSLDILTDASYDFIVCSHILQHITTDEITPLLNQLHQLMSLDGLLVLSYSRAAVGAERYSLEHLQDDKLRSLPLDEEQFNHIVRKNESGNLPIHFIDPDKFVELGQRLRFKELWRWSFHTLNDFGDLDQYIHRDELVNGLPELSRALGRDIMTVWKRV